MPWWAFPLLLGLLSVLGGGRLILQSRRIARRGDPALAVRGAGLAVLGVRVLTAGLTVSALVAMLAYGLR